MLKINNIRKAYGNKIVLPGTNLSVNDEIKILLGINGCGKSTLLKIITGVIEADGGEVFVGENNILSLPPEKRKIGYVPQHTALFTHLTVYENIIYGIRSKEECAKNKEHIENLINMLELREFINKKPTQLSGGYKSRASLARALAPKPCLMLLDEPLSDVDVVMKERLLPEFKKVIHTMGIPTIYVTHDPAEAVQVGDTFSAMVSGAITNFETAEEAFDHIRREELKKVEMSMFKK